jgi:hypothetical protein
MALLLGREAVYYDAAGLKRLASEGEPYKSMAKRT